MGFKRKQITRRDKSESGIVKALRAAGYDVFHDLKTDLAVRKRYWEAGVFKLMEAKTPKNKRNEAHIDKRQKAQIAFLKQTGVPRVTTPEMALEAVRAVTHDKDYE